MNLWRHRKYKSGTGFGFWLWTDVEDNILRLHVIKTPFFAICFHWLRAPDPEPYLHDHPVSFVSIVLRGQYEEIRSFDRGKTNVWRLIRWFNFIRADSRDQHRIAAIFYQPLTLCFMGPKRREWGFQTPKGWIPWRAYYRMKKEQQNGA